MKWNKNTFFPWHLTKAYLDAFSICGYNSVKWSKIYIFFWLLTDAYLDALSVCGYNSVNEAKRHFLTFDICLWSCFALGQNILLHKKSFGDYSEDNYIVDIINCIWKVLSGNGASVFSYRKNQKAGQTCPVWGDSAAHRIPGLLNESLGTRNGKFPTSYWLGRPQRHWKPHRYWHCSWSLTLIRC